MDDVNSIEFKFTPEQALRINRVFECLEENMPHYEKSLKKIILDMVYGGPSIIMPASTPPELLFDVLAYLKRQEIEKCQLLSHRFRDFVNTNTAMWPLHVFDELRIYFDEENLASNSNLTYCKKLTLKADLVVVNVRNGDRSIVTLLEHDLEEGFINYDQNVISRLCTVSMCELELNGLSLGLEKEIFWEFVNKLRELSGEKLNIGCKGIDHYLSSMEVQQLCATIIKTPLLYVLIDASIENNLNKNIDFEAEQIWMAFDVDWNDEYDREEVFDFLQRARFINMEKYGLHLYVRNLYDKKFYDDWLAMFEESNPVELIPRVKITKSFEASDPSNDFVSYTFNIVKCCTMNVEKPPEKKLGLTYISTISYSVKQSKEYRLKVVLDLECRDLYPITMDELLARVRKDIGVIEKVYFVVEKL